MTDDEDVPSFLRALPIGATFTHGRTDRLPDSWIKIDGVHYRRTYDWVRFTADDFAAWTHVELTEPVDYSISQAEADRIEAEARRRPPRTEMGN